MSWSINASSVTPDELREALEKSRDATLPSLNTPAPDETREQCDAAIVAAVALAGAVATGDRLLSVSCSGHANPEHAPCEGWSNDCASISISQVGQR